MMKRVLSLTLLLSGLLLALTANAAKPPIGDRAPDFTLHSSGPYNLRLEEQKGYVVVGVFWASWCRSCPVEMQALERLRKKYSEMGVKIWAITLDKKFDDALHYAAQHHLHYVLLQDSDTKVSERYDIDDLPSTFVVDRDGKLRLQKEGFNPEDEATLDQFLQKLVHE